MEKIMTIKKNNTIKGFRTFILLPNMSTAEKKKVLGAKYYKELRRRLNIVFTTEITKVKGHWYARILFKNNPEQFFYHFYSPKNQIPKTEILCMCGNDSFKVYYTTGVAATCIKCGKSETIYS